MPEPFSFSRSARQKKNVLITGGAVLALALAVLVLRIHPAIAAIFALLLVPALLDIFRNASSELQIDDTALHWRMGARGDSYNLDEIDRVNTKLSLDFSQKAYVIRKSGKRHRIPPPCLPPDGSMDEALKARGVEVNRTLF